MNANANEKAFEISRSFDEVLHDVTYEAASKMAQWLLQVVYDRIDAKRKAIKDDEGWDAYVSMKDVDIILNELNGTPIIKADEFDKALKDIANATFLSLK